MKIKEPDYKQLANYMEAAIMHVGIEGIKDHRAKRLGKDPDVRFAWDIWHVACRVDNTACKWLCDTLYEYLNDSHITTAMKHFVANYPAISI